MIQRNSSAEVQKSIRVSSFIENRKSEKGPVTVYKNLKIENISYFAVQRTELGTTYKFRERKLDSSISALTSWGLFLRKSF